MTDAESAVRSGGAVGVFGTLTGINALFIFALHRSRTIRVNQAFVLSASFIRISLESIGANADGKVVLDIAESINPALFEKARILALCFDARFFQRAL